MALRTATAAAHEAVDRVFSTLDLADRGDYARFLTAQAAAHLPVEEALTRAGAADLVPDWPARRRSALVAEDLADLHLPVPPPIGEIGFASAAATLGGLYVLEGSRLGGRLLRRSVAADLPCRFLDDGDPTAWRRLLILLDDRLGHADDQMIAINAATQVFMLFAQAGQSFLGAI